MKAVVLIGRIFYSLIFITSGFEHFANKTIQYAQSQAVPIASLAVPISGVMAILGGISILIGLKAKWGAWLIVLFLVPVTLMMHNFWDVADPMMRQMQMVMFMKNISMLGAALLIAYHGAGPMSVDNQKTKP